MQLHLTRISFVVVWNQSLVSVMKDMRLSALTAGTALTFAVYRTKMNVFSSSKEQLRCHHSTPLTQDSAVYLQRKPYHLLQWSGQHTDTVKRIVSIIALRSVLTNTVGHLLDVSFTLGIKAKCMHKSNHKVHNRKSIFYLTRTKHDCT